MFDSRLSAFDSRRRQGKFQRPAKRNEPFVSTRRALSLSFLDRYLVIGIYTISSMVIARLLAPAEIGIYSVTMVLLGFIATLRDLGAGQYLVQNQMLSEEKIRAVWTVQLGLGCFFALVAAAGAVPAATLYHEPRMTDILLVLALNFAITPFSAFPNAWLAREMRFGAIAAVRFSGAMVYACTAIGLASLGYGPVSLAWANASTTVASIIVTLAFVRPGLPWKPISKGISDVLSFGGKLTIVSLMDTLSGGAPELLLGKLQSMADAGLFSRGQGLVTMFQRLVMDAVNAVALPYFAKQSRESKNIGASFIVAMELVCGLGWSFMFGIAILAYPAIRILYGSQWDDAVDPARWLAVAYAISIPTSICYAPLISVGAVWGVLRVTLISTIALVIATAIGVGISLVALGQCLMIAEAVKVVVWIQVAKKHIGFSTADLFKCWGKSLIVTSGAVAVPLVVVTHWGWRSPELAITTAIALIGGVLGGCAAAWLTKHQLWVETMHAILRK